MLGIILKILSILGIILLVLLTIAVLVLLLVLFMPIVYKADAEKSDTKIKACFIARWLFGSLRVSYHYPEPGNIIVKILWITIFDSSNKKKKGKKQVAGIEDDVTNLEQAGKESVARECNTNPNLNDMQEEHSGVEQGDFVENNSGEKEQQSLKEKLFAKCEKIKYTIKSFYDKIRHIWENISFYKQLLQDEETRMLFSHTCNRIFKVLHHIRPRTVKANVTFGAESPDTTGYVYGIYCMFSPKMGKDVCIIPDFNQKILQGTVYLAGHITVFKILVNALAILLDKRLHLFIGRVKKHSEKQSKASDNVVTTNE